LGSSKTLHDGPLKIAVRLQPTRLGPLNQTLKSERYRPRGTVVASSPAALSEQTDELIKPNILPHSAQFLCLFEPTQKGKSARQMLRCTNINRSDLHLS